MTLPQTLIAGVALFLLILSIGVVHRMLRRMMKKRDRETVRILWAHAEAQTDPTLKVVEADKVLDEALRMLGYGGTLGDKLKAAGPRLGDEQAAWRAHKLRNSLVHDLGRKADMHEAEQALSDIGRVLRRLGM